MSSSTGIRSLIALLAMTAVSHLAFAQSQIRAVHLSPDGPPIDIYIAGASTPTAAGLTFGGASAVVPVPSGAVRMKVTLGGQPLLVLFDADVVVPENTRIDVLALNSISSPEAATIALPLGGAGSPDSSYLRLVNAIPDGDPVDLRITDTAGVVHSFDGVAFKAQTPFFAIPKGRFTADLYRQGTGILRLHVAGSVPAGEQGTIFLSGLDAGMRLRLMNETRTAQQIPMPILETPAIALIRAVNILPDAPGGFDLSLGGMPLFSGVIPHGATALAAHDTGSYQASIALPGGASLPQPIHLGADSIHTLILLGTRSSPPSVLALARPASMSVPGDSALVRVVDGSAADAPITVRGGTIGPAAIDDVLDFKGISRQVMLPAGALHLDITPAGGILRFRGSGALPGGSIVTLLITTDSTGEFHADLLFESDSGAQIPMRSLLPAGPAKLRVVNVAADADTLKVAVAGDSASHFTVASWSASPVIPDSFSGALHLLVRQGDVGSVAIDSTLMLRTDTLATLFTIRTALGSGGPLGLLSLTTAAADTPSAGMSLIRVIRASAVSGPLGITLDFSDRSTSRFEATKLGESTAYADVPPGSVQIRISSTGPNTLVVGGGDIPPGITGTIVVVDAGTIPPGEGDAAIRAYLLIDSDSGAQQPLIPFTFLADVESDAVAGAGALVVTPNPSHGESRITYTLVRPGSVAIALYDQLGRLVMRIGDDARDAGARSVIIPASSLRSGVYSVLLIRDGATIARERMVVAR